MIVNRHQEERLHRTDQLKHPPRLDSPCRGEGASHQEVSTRVRQREELN